MDALMIALVVAWIGQVGDRTGWLAARLADRDGRHGLVVTGLILAMAVLAVLAAMAVVAGQALAPSLTPEARDILLALSLVLLGIGACRRPRPPSARYIPTRWGSLGGAMLGGGVMMAWDGVPLVVAAAAARSSLPWAAAPGAVLGTLGAVLPPILLGERAWRRLPLRAIRLAAAILLILVGLVIGLSAKGLI